MVCGSVFTIVSRFNMEIPVTINSPFIESVRTKEAGLVFTCPLTFCRIDQSRIDIHQNVTQGSTLSIARLPGAGKSSGGAGKG